jgi:hypothetical protein
MNIKYNHRIQKIKQTIQYNTFLEFEDNKKIQNKKVNATILEKFLKV